MKVISPSKLTNSNEVQRSYLFFVQKATEKLKKKNLGNKNLMESIIRI